MVTLIGNVLFMQRSGFLLTSSQMRMLLIRPMEQNRNHEYAKRGGGAAGEGGGGPPLGLIKSDIKLP